MADTLLTTSQVAERFAVHPSTVIRWANENKLTVIWTPGGHRRFREADCDAFFTDQPQPRSA